VDRCSLAAELEASPRSFAFIPAYRVWCRHDPLDARSRRASRLPQLLIAARAAGKLCRRSGGVRVPPEAFLPSAAGGVRRHVRTWEPRLHNARSQEPDRLAVGRSGQASALRSRWNEPPHRRRASSLSLRAVGAASAWLRALSHASASAAGRRIRR